MATTRVRAEQIVGLQGFPKAKLVNLIPSSNHPNSTGDFILEGAFFTPTMTVVVEGQTVNSITFISDNKMIVNLTTGSTEGLFDITLNNGSGSVTFSDALFIVLGDVFEPNGVDDWTKNSGDLDLSIKGAAKVKVFATTGIATWNQLIDHTTDFKIMWNWAKTPLGNTYTGQNKAITIKDQVTGNSYSYVMDANTNSFGLIFKENGAIKSYYFSSPGQPENFAMELRWNLSTLKLFVNGVHKTLASGYPDVVLANPCKVQATVQYLDIVNLKYIELA